MYEGTVDYSGIPNERDKAILDAVKKYGKGPDGKYIDSLKLIQHLPRASKYHPWNDYLV